MTDLIQQLRNNACSLCHEAADRIERLEERIKRLERDNWLRLSEGSENQ